MRRETILYSKISAAMIAVVLSLALLSPSGFVPALEWIPLMCYAANAPEPDVPLITYGEFPFTVVYEVNGEEYTQEGTVICEYGGLEWSAVDAKKHRIWSYSFENGDYFILYTIDDTTFIALDTAHQPAYLMGDSELNPEHGEAYAFILTYLNYGKSERYMSEKEILDMYGISVDILDFEIAPPIENSFIPVD